MHARPEVYDAETLDALIARCLTDQPRAAAAQIDLEHLWPYVAPHAVQSRVGGLLVQHLRRHGIEPPGPAARQLDAYREHIRAANAFRVARVEPVLARLQHGGVPFRILKGAALNAVLYPDPGVRPMVDVDVLIRPRDARSAQHLLVESGCVLGADLVQDDFYPRYHYEREYFTPGHPPVKIDLHARPFRPLRYARTVPEDAFWRNPQSVRLGRIQVEIPCAEDMLIHLATHAACHGLRELRWLYDVKGWLERFGGRLDWAALGERCRQWKLTLPVRCALEAVSETFGEPRCPLPHALGTAAPRGRLLERLALWQAPYGAQRPALDVLVNCLCTPGTKFKLGYLKNVLLPAPAHMGQVYHRRHACWLLVAHLLRVIRGLARPIIPSTPAEAT